MRLGLILGACSEVQELFEARELITSRAYTNVVLKITHIPLPRVIS